MADNARGNGLISCNGAISLEKLAEKNCETTELLVQQLDEIKNLFIEQREELRVRVQKKTLRSKKKAKA